MKISSKVKLAIIKTIISTIISLFIYHLFFKKPEMVDNDPLDALDGTPNDLPTVSPVLQRLLTCDQKRTCATLQSGTENVLQLYECTSQTSLADNPMHPAKVEMDCVPFSGKLPKPLERFRAKTNRELTLSHDNKQVVLDVNFNPTNGRHYLQEILINVEQTKVAMTVGAPHAIAGSNAIDDYHYLICNRQPKTRFFIGLADDSVLENLPGIYGHNALKPKKQSDAKKDKDTKQTNERIEKPRLKL